jgi:hypothetical protein
MPINSLLQGAKVECRPLSGLNKEREKCQQIGIQKVRL